MSENHLLNGLRNFLHSHKLIARGEKIIVAVSGGRDSIVLLDMLHKLTSELRLELAVAHFNHHLREDESDKDEEFVRATASKHGIECYVERANTATISETSKRSIQETARDLRYDFLTKL